MGGYAGLHHPMTFKLRKHAGCYVPTYIGHQLQKTFGLTAEKAIDRNIYDIFPADFADVRKAYLDRVWQGEEVIYESEAPGGATILVCLQPEYQNQEIVEAIATCIDITEYKQAQRELFEAKEVLESFVAHTADAIVILDLEGRILRVNPAFETTYGYKEEEVLGTWLPTVPEELSIKTIQLYKLAAEGCQITGYETVRLRKNGAPIHVSVTISPIRNADGQVVAISGVARDISDRIHMERAMRRSEARYRLIAENMSDFIGVFDITGKLEYASPSCETLLGIPLRLLTKEAWMERIYPDDQEHVKVTFRDFLQSSAPCVIEFRLHNGNGQWVYLEAHFSPVQNENGLIEQVLIVARDVTERKQTEEFLRKSEKLSVVGQLAAGVAHEIRNPLTALKGFTQLLQMRTGTDGDYFSIMLSELDRIEFIVNEFLLLAKPKPSSFQGKNLLHILQDVVSLLATHAILGSVQIKLQAEAKDLHVTCDENQLKQVFINLLKNGMEAMPDGGLIEITVENIEQDKLRIRIRDEGCGIPEELLPRLGEPFYTTKEKGTGLGLMICHKIISDHHGLMNIASIVQEGTTIEIVLPLSMKEMTAEMTAS